MAATQENRLLSIKTPLEDDFLLLDRLNATEEISELFHYEVDLLHEENDEGHEPTDVDVASLLGQLVSITIAQRDGTTRTFNGMVNTFAKGHRTIRFSHYHATIVPRVWLLTQNFQSRIFQHMSVPDILEQVFDGFNVSFEIQGQFEKRDYCCQYQESDFDFASRTMEEEGLYYYFEHSGEEHTMIVADTPQSHRDCPSKSDIEYFTKSDSTQEDFISTIRDIRIDHKLQPGAVSFRDFNFQLVTNKLEANQPTLFSVGDNQKLEVYKYPAGYGRKYDGIDRGGGTTNELDAVFPDKQRTAENEMSALDSGYRVLSGGSDCCSLTPGHLFNLTSHPTKEINAQYLITSVDHRVKQSPAYLTGEEIEAGYESSFSCISHGAGAPKFCPPIKTKKPKIYGAQTAMVVGPAGEEIYTDKYGRVKVQFHWDRDGTVDADSSCWIRVAQAWAGNRWGMMVIPRIGMEVVVEFLEGDPDSPIIKGCVYNPETMPPYELPDEKTKSTIKTDSSKGGNGFNEIRFEDKKGEEQLFFHAEKDQDIRVKNDRREIILNDRHLIVNRDKRDRIKRDEHRIVERDLIENVQRDIHRKVGGKQAEKVVGTYSRKVTGNVTEEFGANYSTDTTGFHTIKAANIVLEADTAISMKVGGSFITISSAGIFIKGAPMTMINSGGAAISGMPGNLVSPLGPEESMIADNADPGSRAPTYRNQQRQIPKWQKPSFEAPTHRPNSSKNEDKKSWIEVKLVDEDGNPVPGERYRVTLPDGSTLSEGTTDENGEARVENIDPGNCKITFPELHEDSWEEG